MSATEVADDSLEHWKNKCRELERVVKTLSSHCFKVVEKHEELLGKYKVNEEQYEQLVARLKDTEEQLSKMRKLVEPVYSEYEVMKNKYEIEEKCRQHAEEYATKVTKQNKVLKRQSQMLLQQRGLSIKEINLEEEGEEGQVSTDDDSQKEYIKNLNDRIATLEEDNARLKTEVKELKEDVDIEKDKRTTYSYQNESLKAELMHTKQSLQQHKDALKRLANASEMATKEFEHLKGSYEQEIICRDRAEKYAATLFAEKEAARRQSSMLLMNVASDRRLMEAMIEVENLTTKVEEQKGRYELQIKELQEEVETLRQKDSLESLEQENSQLTDERESLYKQLADLEQQNSSLRSQYGNLQTQYDRLEKRLEEATKPPPAPPPPPPPPPPSKKLGIFSRNKKKKEIKKKLETGGAAVNDGYNKALEEMMKRIREGKPLKRTAPPTRRPSCPDETDASAMGELRGMLSKMKKASSMGDLTAPSSASASPPSSDQESELAQAFRKIKRPSIPDGTEEDSSPPQNNDVQLRGQDPKPVPKPRGPKQLSRVSEMDENTFEPE